MTGTKVKPMIPSPFCRCKACCRQFILKPMEVSIAVTIEELKVYPRSSTQLIKYTDSGELEELIPPEPAGKRSNS